MKHKKTHMSKTKVGVKGVPASFGKASGELAAAAEKGIILHDYVRNCRRALSTYHSGLVFRLTHLSYRVDSNRVHCNTTSMV